MPPARVHRAAFVLVIPLVLAGAGCSVVSRVRDVADNVKALTEISDTLKTPTDQPYTTEYRTSSGKTVTMVHAPPRSAYRGPDGTYIASPEFTLLCQRGQCQKAPAYAAVALTDEAKLSAVTGPGFASASYVTRVLGAAALVPEVVVQRSSTTIAGQGVDCVQASGLSPAPDAERADAAVEDFTLCATADGVIASFHGVLPDGSRGTVTLTSYSTSADPMAFAAPADLQITEVRQLSIS